MDKPLIIENKLFNKELYRVVLKINNENIVTYVDIDGDYDNLSKLDENGNEVLLYDVDPGMEPKYVGIFDKMIMNYEIGFSGPDVE